MGKKDDYGSYIKIYDFMINDFKLAKYELLVYAYIFAMDRYGRGYDGSQQFLADHFNTSRKTINEVLKNLVDANLILKEEKVIWNGKGCVYTINYNLIKV